MRAVTDFRGRRMMHQRISNSAAASPVEVVSHMGAMQAQDYRNALWAVGLRTPSATEAVVEGAVAAGAIVRTWPMRGTLHFVAAADVHWMLELLTPRVIAAAAKRAEVHRLDVATLSRCRELCVELLCGGQRLTRAALFAELNARGIATEAQRGYHILWRLAQERLICFGPHEGKQPTFVLLDEWVPPTKRARPRDPLAELARRYFSSHGPATLQDFVWWCGLKVVDARAAIAAAGLTQESIDGVPHWTSAHGAAPAGDIAAAAHLLPAFDEYLLGYRDRSAALDALHAGKVVPGNNGVFQPTVVVNGRIVGTWKRAVKARAVIVTIEQFAPLSRSARSAITTAADSYGRFMSAPVELRFA